jgi:hypothetical protein
MTLRVVVAFSVNILFFLFFSVRICYELYAYEIINCCQLAIVHNYELRFRMRKDISEEAYISTYLNDVP